MHAVTYTGSARLYVEAELTTLAEKSTAKPTDLKLNLVPAMEARVASVTSQMLPPTLAATHIHSGVVAGEGRG